MLKRASVFSASRPAPLPAAFHLKSCSKTSATVPPVRCPSRQAQPQSSCRHRAKVVTASASWDDIIAGNSGRSDAQEEFVEVQVDSVRVSHGVSVVTLRLVGTDRVIPVHIGEAESSALQKELNKIKHMRPLTHDLTKNLLEVVGFSVKKVCITQLVSSTFFSRVYITRPVFGGLEEEEADVDARPSDAINLAMRFGAPVYVSKAVADVAAVQRNPDGSTPKPKPSPAASSPSTSSSSSAASASSSSAQVSNNIAYFKSSTSSAGVPSTQLDGLELLALVDSNSDTAKSVRDTLHTFEDPTIMLQLQKHLAVQQQRYEDAAALQRRMVHEMTHNAALRLAVAMEAALLDGRLDEAARLRDDYRRLTAARIPSDKKQTTA